MGLKLNNRRSVLHVAPVPPMMEMPAAAGIIRQACEIPAGDSAAVVTFTVWVELLFWKFIHDWAAKKENIFAHLSQALLLSVGGTLPNDPLLTLTAPSLCF